MRWGAVVLVMVALLAGCAEPAAPPPGKLAVVRLPPPDALVRQASGQLFDAGTGELTETMTARAGDRWVTRTTTGRFDLSAPRAQLRTTFTASGPDAVAALLGRQVPLDTLTSELVRDGSTLYLTKPSWTGALRGRWMRYEGEWLGGLGRRWSDVLGPPWDPDHDMTDPAASALLSLPQKMTGTGGFLPGDPDTSRYQIRVPLSEARPVIGASTRVAGTSGVAGDDTGSGEEITVEVEVGAAPGVRKVRLDATRLVERVLGPGAGRTGPVEYTAELSVDRLGQPVRIEAPPAAAQQPGGVWVQDLQPGTCLAADPAAARHLVFTPASCDRSHGFEVYARVTLAAAEATYPGQRQLEQRALQLCAAQLTRYLGEAPGPAGPATWTAVPGEGRWLQGDRDAPCVLDPGQPVTGLLRSSGG
jgi:Septum formation